MYTGHVPWAWLTKTLCCITVYASSLATFLALKSVKVTLMRVQLGLLCCLSSQAFPPSSSWRWEGLGTRLLLSLPYSNVGYTAWVTYVHSDLSSWWSNCLCIELHCLGCVWASPAISYAIDSLYFMIFFLYGSFLLQDQQPSYPPAVAVSFWFCCYQLTGTRPDS